jgi:hypothetical protein
MRDGCPQCRWSTESQTALCASCSAWKNNRALATRLRKRKGQRFGGPKKGARPPPAAGLRAGERLRPVAPFRTSGSSLARSEPLLPPATLACQAERERRSPGKGEGTGSRKRRSRQGQMSGCDVSKPVSRARLVVIIAFSLAGANFWRSHSDHFPGGPRQLGLDSLAASDRLLDCAWRRARVW